MVLVSKRYETKLEQSGNNLRQQADYQEGQEGRFEENKEIGVIG